MSSDISQPAPLVRSESCNRLSICHGVLAGYPQNIEQLAVCSPVPKSTQKRKGGKSNSIRPWFLTWWYRIRRSVFRNQPKPPAATLSSPPSFPDASYRTWKIIGGHTAESRSLPIGSAFLAFSAGTMVTSGALPQQHAVARPSFRCANLRWTVRSNAGHPAKPPPIFVE